MEISSPVLMFAFCMFVILIAPAFFEKFRLPGIVGLIVAGILIGPHALGVLASEEPFRLFSSVGLLYILFLAGLEINVGEFKRQKKNSIVFGVLTFVIPMVLGTFGARYLFSFSWAAAILLASMFASHTLIPFPITSRLGINKEKAIVATVGGTIITDTAAMLVLAIIAESATHNLTALFWVWQLAFLIILVWFSMWALPRLAYFLFKLLAPDGASEFLLTLGLVFLTAHFAHLAGVEPIIGAFFAGLSLGPLISDQSPLKNRLEFVGNTFFIPFFLISVGMLVNLRVMFSGWDVWAMALFMASVAILCKYVAARLSQKILHFTRDEFFVIFGLSVNQAAATLAAVIVGYRLGIFNEVVLNGTIFMILVTCLIGPWFTEKYGQNIARSRQQSALPGHGGEKRIIVAVSHDESAELLTDVALSVRGSDSKDPIFPLHVIQDGLNIDRRIFLGEKVLSSVVSRIVAADAPVFPISRIDVNISGGILRAVKEHQGDVLILGVLPSQKTNLKTMLFDVSDRVCDGSHQLLFLCKMLQPLNMGKKVFLFIPPMLEYLGGFFRALEAINLLAKKNKLHLDIIGKADTIQFIETSHLAKSLKGEVSFYSLDIVRDFSAYLKSATVKESDSIILMAERKGRLGWNPSLKRLFHALASDFPKNNIMMTYLPDTEREGGEGESPYKENNVEAPRVTIPAAVNITKITLEDAVRELLLSHFVSSSKVFSEIIKKIFPLEPIELSSGIVLFHTHSEHITEPIILLGVGSCDIQFASVKNKIHALFILISPKDNTNIHLQALTTVAKMAKELEPRQKA
jgi:Kef-type K+ transport system membrane component KefB/mannitol/fructose-specific phosphotransferase system IIA component (Ntr-type)